MNSEPRPVWARKYGTETDFSGFHQLLLQGYIGVGWPDVGDITTMETMEQIRDALHAAYPQDGKTKLSSGAGILHAFVNTAQIDDLVAVHSQENGRIYLGRIVGPSLFNTGLHKYFHLLRQVEWSDPLHPGLIPDVEKTLAGRNVFWKVSDPAELLSAYEAYGRFKMRLLAPTE